MSSCSHRKLLKVGYESVGEERVHVLEGVSQYAFPLPSYHKSVFCFLQPDVQSGRL